MQRKLVEFLRPSCNDGLSCNLSPLRNQCTVCFSISLHISRRPCSYFAATNLVWIEFKHSQNLLLLSDSIFFSKNIQTVFLSHTDIILFVFTWSKLNMIYFQWLSEYWKPPQELGMIGTELRPGQWWNTNWIAFQDSAAIYQINCHSLANLCIMYFRCARFPPRASQSAAYINAPNIHSYMISLTEFHGVYYI